MLQLPDDLQCYKQISIESKDKAQFFLNKHSTKEGSWGILKLNYGEINFIFMDENNHELSCQHVTPDNPEVIVFPGALHKIQLIDDKDFNANIDFYCNPHRYFEKKYGFKKPHTDLIYANDLYLPKDKKLNVLDLGCGSGRNLLFLAKQGHHVTGIDINDELLKEIKNITQQENMTNIELIHADLNTPLDLEKDYYDLVIATVSLQFLSPTSIHPLLEDLRKATAIGGIHLFVFPIEEEPFKLPDMFIYLPKKRELYENYQNAGWSLLEYNEKVGQLHKLDEFGYPIQGKFGFLLAQRIF